MKKNDTKKNSLLTHSAVVWAKIIRYAAVNYSIIELK